MFVIYQITNLIDKKSYIGFTVSPRRRWQAHKHLANYGSETHLHRAMRKYGNSNFMFSILEEGWSPEIGIKVREPYWISALKPQYNMTAGGEGIFGLCEQSRAKISSKLIGKPKSPTHCRAIGDCQRGIKKGPRPAQSVWQRGKIRGPYKRIAKSVVL